MIDDDQDEHVAAYWRHIDWLDLAPWRDGDWVTAAEAIDLLRNRGIADPANQLTVWAAADTGTEFLIRVRADLVEVTLESTGAKTKSRREPLFSWLWLPPFVLVRRNWEVNSLRWERDVGTGAGIIVDAFDVELSAGDLQRRVGREPAEGLSRSAERSATPKLGRPKGTDTYPSDANIVSEVIERCDAKELAGGSRLRTVIKTMLDRIEPKSLDDEAKIKRIRLKVIASRPDLRT